VSASTSSVPPWTLVATLDGATPGSAAPGAAPDMTVPGNWYGYPSVLPVIGQTPGWLDVRLAQRPNQSTAWVPASDATLSTTPYSMVLNLTTEHLTVYQSGQEIFDFPAGIGTPDDPTVTGDYFIAMVAPPPDPSYGPFLLVTSAHSDAIADWEGSGDAIIAIHGPITAEDDSLIGTTGAQISHGCIRLHDSDLAQLDMIRAGTPLDIVS
jgi:L,D-transpeptidase catalytic domain